jgi:hypothetical protein
VQPRPITEKSAKKQGDGGDYAASGLWCQEERLQDVVVELRRRGKAEDKESTKIFVDNTKTFVLSSAHDQGTFAKANGV